MISHLVSHLKFVKRNEFILDKCKGKNTLHLGCTDAPMHKQQYDEGRLLHLKLLKTCKTVYGVDIAEEPLEWMKQTLGKGCYYLGNIEDSVFMNFFKNKEVEIILLSDVIEHLDNPFSALCNIHNICNSSTELIVTVPNAYSIKTYLRVFAGYEMIHPDHVAFYSPYTLTNLLNRCGFACSQYFGFSGGGKNRAAMIMNSFLKYTPRLAEGIGVVAKIVKRTIK